MGGRSRGGGLSGGGDEVVGDDWVGEEATLEEMHEGVLSVELRDPHLSIFEPKAGFFELDAGPAALLPFPPGEFFGE